MSLVMERMRTSASSFRYPFVQVNLTRAATPDEIECPETQQAVLPEPPNTESRFMFAKQ